MYLKFYGLNGKPFGLNPDPDFLYFGQSHQMALRLLEYSLESEAGITVITGEVGCGKTTLIHHLLANLDSTVRAGLVANTHSDFGEFMKWVLMSFEQPYQNADKPELYERFQNFLTQEFSAGYRTALIVDETQNLNVNSLEELRMLSNINYGKHSLLQLVLVGQTELLDKLKRPELRQLAQRVSVDYQLNPLNLHDTVNYIKHRLKVVGREESLFDTFSMATIFYHSGGVPRLINSLCDLSLVYGYSAQHQMIGARTILAVLKDKAKTGLFPTHVPETEQAKKVRELVLEKSGVDIAMGNV
jgi:general secretion pathway protein A